MLTKWPVLSHPRVGDSCYQLKVIHSSAIGVSLFEMHIGLAGRINGIAFPDFLLVVDIAVLYAVLCSDEYGALPLNLYSTQRDPGSPKSY